ncbi:MAG: hypothetical protein WCA98_03550 [Candidatus Acidiferrales bacterium]
MTSTRNRPLSVTILGGLFIVVGLASSVSHLLQGPLDRWIILILVVNIIAIVGGVFLLIGHGWACWLMLAWLSFHVIVSAFHSVSQTIAHVVLLLVISYFLLARPASKYFQSAPSE